MSDKRKTMEKEIVQINLLAIAITGLIMFFLGLLLYLFKVELFRVVRFFLPIPPIGVAAYVFVFNLFKFYEGRLPADMGAVVREIILSTVISALVFAAMTTLLIVAISIFRKFTG